MSFSVLHPALFVVLLANPNEIIKPPQFRKDVLNAIAERHKS